jgi:hypothetical protein
MFDPQDGTWYIVVTPEKCQSTIFIFRDLTQGKGSLRGRYIVLCPRCSHKGCYDDARHYRRSLSASSG